MGVALMRSRTYQALLAIGVALGLLVWASQSSPAKAVILIYNTDCDTAILPQDIKVVVPRGAGLGGTGSDYYGVQGDATVQVQYPCDAVFVHNQWWEFDTPAVLPANLQNSAGDIVQIGYAVCGAAAGQVCDTPIPNDGKPHFVYMCDDQSAGTSICVADSWAGLPSYGTRYRFRVQYNELGHGQWDYSITNLSTGAVKRPPTGVASHWHFGNGAWWGAEVHNQNSTLGRPDLVASLRMSRMQYLRTANGSTWWTVTDLQNAPQPYKDNGEMPGTGPCWYHWAISDGTYNNDTIDIYTSTHHIPDPSHWPDNTTCP